MAFSNTLLAQGEQANVELERSSGVPFPLELEVPGETGSHVLAGTGIRTKTFLKVKVYAFGLYVDHNASKTALADYANLSVRNLEENQDFFDRILDLDFGMTLRLVMTRDVGGDDMADAFDGALRPRVIRAEAELGMPGGEAALDTFREFFDVDEMTKEAELLFTCLPDGSLHTTIKGVEAPIVQSPALCWALFDTYLGEDPISKGGKKSVISHFPHLLVSTN